MKRRKILDWLTATHHSSGQPYDVLPDGVGVGRRLHPTRFYPLRHELIPAGIISVGETEKQGVMLQWSGSDCAKLREAEINPYELMLHLKGLSCKITRVDYAIDMMAEEEIENAIPVDPHDAYRHWKWGLGDCKIRNEPLIHTSGRRKGYTCDFGSRKSDRFVRVYDKAAEMKMLERAWIRVELQSRKDRAQAISEDMMEWGLENAGDTAIRQLVDFPKLNWWHEALSGDMVEMTTVPKKPENWQWFLENQVGMLIAKRAIESPASNEFLREWLAKYAKLVFSIDSFTSDNGTSAKG